MSTLTSVGPMIINGGMPQPGQPGNGVQTMMAPNHIAYLAAPNGGGSPFPPHHMAQNYRTALGVMPGSSSAPTPPTTTTSTAAINRSQRCGVCRGCQCKPCGLCTYCQDSPQFGGPGVKKQSCIERRCLRVLENRLQRDAPTFKARVGCNNCDDCRMADCGVCLVCLDKRFFDNRYMTGALCAKKRCNNATSLELPSQQQQQNSQQLQQQQQQQQQNNDNRQMMKRSFDASSNGTPQNGYDYVMAKQQRRGAAEMQQQQTLQPPPPQNGGIQIQQQQQQQRVMMQVPPQNGGPQIIDPNGYQQQQPQLIRIVQQQPPHPQQQQQQQMQPPQQPPMGPPHMSLLVPMSTIPNSEPPQQSQQQQQIKTEINDHSQPQQIQINNGATTTAAGATVITLPHSINIQNLPQQLLPPLPPPQQQIHQNGIVYPSHFIQNNVVMSHHYNDYQKMYGYPKYEYYDCDPNNRSPQDPYVPPSYSGEANKNEIILQPL